MTKFMKTLISSFLLPSLLAACAEAGGSASVTTAVSSDTAGVSTGTAETEVETEAQNKFESYTSPYEDEPEAKTTGVKDYGKVDATTLAGKVICGYQAWFNTPGSGIGFKNWFHWAGSTPSKGNISFEIYPDTREYADEALYKTNLGALGNGTVSRLYSANIINVIDTHFRWMAEYGIDGVALQRFVTDATNTQIYEKMTQVIDNVGKSSEKYGRIFYLCYDISGASDSGFYSKFTKDFESIREKLLSYKSYLYHDGKPVIEVWGLGVNGNCKVSAAEGAKAIQYLKDLGFYVIGGTPTNWKTETGDAIPGYSEVYKLYDMISPWQVGRFSGSQKAASYMYSVVKGDMKYCEKLGGKDYMPVIFPGFAWSNWNGGKMNEIKREAGKFIWAQARAVARTECTAVYIAMFDEYDEGTALAKGAEDSSMIPGDQYFYTYAADGKFLASDYYLRLAGRITDLFASKTPYSDYPEEPDVVFSTGSVYMRTGFEENTDPKASVEEKANTSGAKLEQSTDKALSGNVSYKLTTAGAGDCEFKLLDIESNVQGDGYAVGSGMKVRFFVWSPNNDGLHVSLEVYTASGKKLSQTAASALPTVDTAQCYGKPNDWSRFTVEVGKYLEGETITGIGLRLSSDNAATVYIDNVLVFNGE